MRRDSRGQNRQAARQTMESRIQGASMGISRGGLNGYLLRHLQVAIQSLGRLSRTPFASFMTAAVIGIALALPAGLYTVLENVQRLGGQWDESARISLFLKPHVSETRALQLAQKLHIEGNIAKVDYISQQQALDEFKRFSSFGDLVDSMSENPLPAVLVVYPSMQGSDTTQMQHLVDQLQRHPEVDMAQLDMEWVQRLLALIDIAQRAILVIAILLSLAVLLTIGNTIRLAIENRREEIVVTKLIGATNAFIRRPFLYFGLWFGFFGGLLALLLVNLSLWYLQGPVQHLTGLYGDSQGLHSLDGHSVLTLLGSALLLGLLGAWLAVGRHLRHIEPQ